MLLKQAGIASARLDAELILAHTIRKPRTYLHAHGDMKLSDKHNEIASARLELRCNHTPIAYITGHKEFYGRQFKTTPAALVPRPESEAIITLLKDKVLRNITQISGKKIHLVDVGTGTGCLGITTKLEWPELEVVIIDNSIHALNLAKENAALLKADVRTLKNDLLGDFGMPIDIIIANLPYVDHGWEVSLDTQAEPPEALYAGNGGLTLIYRLLDQAALLLKPNGYILLESDPRQQDEIINHAKSLKLNHEYTENFITVFSRS
ncbi:MAG: peptide chain release factor N(5)-glutamine methyltransferase [Candidatus Nomurabacteria bacterium]|nr:MAG: peptide chain release factor N(5)-glutamine methyltransferase [Candidatus Nomurabacteria bacterium]